MNLPVKPLEAARPANPPSPSVTRPDLVETRIGPLEPFFDKSWRPSEIEPGS